jgi:hypothetical protein
MEPQITNVSKLKKIINNYSNNNEFNKCDTVLFNVSIFIIFIIISAIFLSYKYRIKNNISF